MRKRLLTSFLAVAMLIGTCSASAEPVKLKFATYAPPKSVSNTVVFNDWLKKMNAEGTVKVDSYMGGILGKGGLIYKNLQDGVADMSYIVPDWIIGQFPDDQVLNLPFMSKSGKESSLSAYALYQKGLLTGYDDIKVLGLFATGVYYIQSSYPIRKPGDLKGKKIAVFSNFHADIIKQLGGIGVGMPAPKVAENMSRGIIEGWISDISAVFAFRVNDVAKHHLMLPFGNSTLLVAMNKKAYAKLSPAAQATINRHSGEVLVRKWAKMMDDQVEIKLALLKKDPKHSVVIPTAEELKQWNIAIQPAIDKWKTADPKREMLTNAYQKELDNIRSGM